MDQIDSKSAASQIADPLFLFFIPFDLGYMVFEKQKKRTSPEKSCQGKTVGRVYDRTVSGVSDPAIYNKLFSTSMEGPYHGYSADRAAGNGYRLHRIYTINLTRAALLPFASVPFVIILYTA